MDSKCIIVVGCYRTGSSAVAGILHKLGVNMGEEFLPGNENNEHGYFEDQEFVRIHKEFNVEAYEALVVKKSQQPLWGFKDPYFVREDIAVRAIPIIQKYCECQFIITKRNQDQICKSLERALPAKEADFIPLVQWHCLLVDELCDSLKEKPLVIEFEDLKRHPVATTCVIANYIKQPISEEALLHFSNT